MKILMPYVYSRPYVYYFWQNFHALRLFPALRLFRTLEYSLRQFFIPTFQRHIDKRYHSKMQQYILLHSALISPNKLDAS